ncbi:AMP-binding protein [Acinetobacter soli]|nr:AMP-binding protein [Acinetobacter soli]WEH92788.1 AMP-binding protein [Acinetobacter soli]WEI01395.1 AMP-binding protein [Acinetobacter soli]
MFDYQKTIENFNLETVAKQYLSGSMQAVNACYECCDRHADSDAIALYWYAKDGRKEQYSFRELKKYSTQFASFLKSQGVRKGDRVSGLLPRTPELIITILATWRIGAVYHPLFTAFGPKAIEHRIQLAQSKLVVTDLANREKLSEISNCPSIVTVQAELHAQNYPQDFDFWRELNRQTETVELEMLSINDPFLLMFTSGTTGPAKPLKVPLKALIAFGDYMKNAIGLSQDDIFGTLQIQVGPMGCITPLQGLYCSGTQHCFLKVVSMPKVYAMLLMSMASPIWRVLQLPIE